MRYHTCVLSSATALHSLTESPGRKGKTLGVQVAGLGVCWWRRWSAALGEKRILMGKRESGKEGEGASPLQAQTSHLPGSPCCPLDCLWLCQKTTCRLTFSSRKCPQNLTFHFGVQQRRPTNSPICHFREGFLAYLFFHFVSL